jgi:predicted N-acetyltransferase YhbS
MRATYVDPRWARQGLATLLARLTETAATAAGYRRFEALCTPASEALRQTLGYRLVGHERTVLAGGVTVDVARMRKELTDERES